MNEPNANLEISSEHGKPLVRLVGPLVKENVPALYDQLRHLLKSQQPPILDLEDVPEIDSFGVAFIGHCLDRFGTGPKGCELRNANETIAENLAHARWRFHDAGPVGKPATSTPGASGGGNILEKIEYFAFVISEVFYQAVVGPFRGSKPRFNLFVEQLSRLGAGSAPIVLTVAALVGLTTALQAAYQLRQFGANIYIADLVGISMVRELGPLMAAILVAGRSGSAITAEISTMKVNEELDALQLMGVNPIQFLAAPRIYAITFTQPMLSVASAFTGIGGGLFIAMTMLDLSSASYFNETLTAIFIDDLFFNIYKSIAFGWIIVTVAVYYGLRVSGGAEGVGRATTSSVVVAIAAIIVADAAFSFL